MKKLMIMGAGIYQVPLIKTAKRLGFYTLVVSIPGDFPGFSLADAVLHLDTRDTSAVLAAAKKEKISAICTAGTDVAVATIGVVCDALGLKGMSARAAMLCTDKSLMKQAFIAGGVRTAAYERIYSKEQCHEAFDRLTKPVMFKAVDSSGSRGIIKVSEDSEINASWDKVFSITKCDYFIMEEFLEGFEFGVQAFIFGGRIRMLLPHGDMVHVEGDAGVPIGHYAPIEADAPMIKDCEEQTLRGIAALGLDNCAVNVDCICSRGQVYVLELGARVGATCLPELVSLYYGIDYYEIILRAALGEKPVFPEPVCLPNASLLLKSDVSGIYKGIRTGAACQDPHVVEISMDVQPGAYVRAFRVGPDRIGQIIVTGNSLKDALDRVYRVEKSIVIDVEPE